MILSRLLTQLKNKYGEEWVDLEPETISLDLGVFLDPKSLQGLNMLRTVVTRPARFAEDASYLLAYIEAANNNLIDPTHIYMPDTLEIAWAIYDLARIMNAEDAKKVLSSQALRKITLYMLREEGYSEPVYPFTAYIKSDELLKGESKQANANKAKAVNLYIKAMEDTDGEG